MKGGSSSGKNQNAKLGNYSSMRAGVMPGAEASDSGKSDYSAILAAINRPSAPAKPVYQSSGFAGYTAPAALPKHRVNAGGYSSAV